MDLKFNYTSADTKKKKKRQVNLEYSNDKSFSEIFLKMICTIVCTLLTSAAFLGFVVKIVMLMNRPFYYFCNNRFFYFMEET